MCEVYCKMYPFREYIWETIKEHKLFFAGLATVALSAGITRTYFPSEKTNLFIFDQDQDGYLDIIIDNNWWFILARDPKSIASAGTHNRMYRICYTLTDTQLTTKTMTEKEFLTQVRPLLEKCMYETYIYENRD